MVSLNQLEKQLNRAGCNFRFWGRGEKRELAKILTPDEQVAHCVNGHYEGGFAMLAVTDQRLLLIDHKPMFISVEDIRFDMIAEIDYGSQLVMSNVKIITPSKTLRFVSWSQHHLREVLNLTQQRMLELRQNYSKVVQQIQPIIVADQATAGLLLGSLAVQTGGAQRPLSLPLNPYANKMPVLQRRRTYPRFY